ncbi:MAG: imidazole glycerol phosphate synthase subunit HisH [Cyclobacteriaceae bacterium]
MIAVVKYNAGNIRSLVNALDRFGVDSVLTDDPDVLRSSGKVIFPGVGEASSAMGFLKERGLDEVIKSLTQPFLGICLGMQLMCEYSEENDTNCLGIFDETVRRFPAEEVVPHMGWNDFVSHSGHLFEGISTIDNMYFVHSYFVELGQNSIATTNYILPFSSGLHKNNFYGVQFHPEKSAEVGEQLLRNFVAL